jgi:hypothetical protein
MERDMPIDAPNFVQRSRRQSGVRAASALFLVAGLAAQSLSQTATPAAAPTSAKAASKTADTPEVPLPIGPFAAQSVVRVALLDLRAQREASERDYALAADLLGIAQALDPSDAMIVRRRIEAAWNARDADLARELNRRLVQLEPGNTVAQLSVITSELNRLQTSEERLAAMDRFIGSKTIDASVRSRIALDAALLLRERGDDAGFGDRLRTALKLDSTNKAAANLAVNVFGGDDPSKQFELLSNLLLADPIDGTVLAAISKSLAQAGAFEQAQRFDQLVTKIEVASNQGRTFEGLLNSLILKWQNKGAAPVVDELQKQLAILRDDAEKQKRAFEESRTGLESGTPQYTKPEDVTLPHEADRVRLLAADACGKPDLVAAVVADMGVDLVNRTKMLTDPKLRDPSMSAEDAAAQVASIKLSLAIARAWANVGLDLVKAERPKFGEVSTLSPAALALLDAMVTWRDGDIDKARTQLRDLADGDSTARAALAELERGAGNTDVAASLYLDVARADPSSALGAWARSKHRDLTGKELPLTPAAQQLETLARQIPDWVDRAIGDPRTYMSMNAKLVGTTLHPTQPARVRVTLRNLAPQPLAVGPDSPLGTRLLIGPYGDSRVRTLDGLVPEVSLIERRLRLNPNETMEVDLDPDAGLSGWSIGAASDSTVRVRYRVLQGFSAESGVVEHGSQSISTETQALVRPPLTVSKLSVEELAGMIKEGVHELPTLILASRAKLLKPDAAGLEPLVAALTARLQAGPLAEQAALIAGLPPAGVVTAMAPFDKAALALLDASMRALALVSRARPDDAVIQEAAEGKDGMFGRFGQALLERKDAGGTFLGVNWVKASTPAP